MEPTNIQSSDISVMIYMIDMNRDILKILLCISIALSCTMSSYGQNNALHFDGIDDYVEMNSPIEGNVNFTLEAWFRYEVNGGGFKRLVSLNGPTSRYEIGVDNGNIAYFVHPDNDSGTNHTITNSVVSNGSCHHIATVKSETDFIIYLDGVQIVFIEDHFDSTFSLGDGQFMRLGRWGTSSNEYWKGLIDEVRVWGFSRSQIEINSTKDIQLLGTEKDLITYYDFNQGDPSGSNQSGVLLSNESYLSYLLNGSLNNFSLEGNKSNWIESCTDLRQYCEVDCCTEENDGMENLPLGVLPNIPPSQAASWTEPSSTALVLPLGCQDSKSIQLPIPSNSSGLNYLVYSAGSGNNGDIALFSEGEYYCISLCAKVSSGSGALAIFLEAEPFWIFDPINSTDGWVNISIPRIFMDKDYYDIQFLYLNGGDPDSKIQIDNLCIEESEAASFCKAKYSFEILDCGQICFTDISCGEDYSISWLIAEEMFSNESNPCYSVEESGEYNFCLSIEGDDCLDMYCETIQIDYMDDEPPILINGDVEIYLDSEGEADIILDDLGLIISDNCQINEVIFESQNVNCDDLGELEKNLTLTDVVGNSSSLLLNIQVIDTIGPIFSSTSLNLFLDETGSTSLPQEEILDIATDNCQIDEVIFEVENLNCNDLGELTQEVTLIDNSGNATTSLINIAVIDTIPPKCIEDQITAYLNENGEAIFDFLNEDAVVVDNCNEVEYNFTVITFSCLAIGENLENLPVNDLSGNTQFCSLMITVIDTIPPVVLSTPINVYLDENGNATISTANIDVFATDNCSVESIEMIDLEVSCNDLGDIQTEIFATDQSGNQSIELLDITVIDTIGPICFIEEISMVLDENGIVEINTSLFDSEVTDNCGEVTIEPQFLNFNCENIGVNLVDLSITDEAGNQSICTIEVEVLDKVDTDCELEDVIVESTEENGAFVTFELLLPSLCGIGSLSFDPPSESFFECGTHEIVATYEGNGSNNFECEFTLFVEECEGCCISEIDFTEITNQGFTLELKENNGNFCLVQLFPPEITDCQFVTQLIWDDGTITNGLFPKDVEFLHEYSSAGDFHICITIKEYNDDNDACFEKQICQNYSLQEGCQLVTSSEEETLIDIEIFPVPSINKIFIKANIEFTEYTVIDLMGQVIDKAKLQQSNIDISKYPMGMYVLILQKEEIKAMKQIIKID